MLYDYIFIIPTIMFSSISIYFVIKQLHSFRGSLTTLAILFIQLVSNLIFGVPNKTRFSLFIQLSVFVEYCIVFFYVYHPIGKFLFSCSLFLLFNGLADAPNWAIYLVLFFVVTPLSSSVTLYFLVQFDYIRLLLIELIGKENFSSYVGDNPGTAQLKKMATNAGFIVSAAIFADGFNKVSQVAANSFNADNYLKSCESANIPSSEPTLAKIYSTKAPSVVEMLFGRR